MRLALLVSAFLLICAPASAADTIAGGLGHTCAVKTDGAMACWGDNGSGQSTLPAGTYTKVAANDLETARSAPAARRSAPGRASSIPRRPIR